jgi:predicted dehydrogenase
MFRIGLIGAGALGCCRAEAVRALPDAELVAVADVDEAQAAKAAALGGPVVAVSSDPLAVARRDDLDGVIVATPPRWHEEIGLACLEAGKHVLCEKPLATSSEACQRLVDAADLHQRTLATGFTLRHTPAAQRARALVDSGAIGEIDHVRAFHGHPGDEFSTSWVRDATVSGGGTLFDNGIHMIDMALWFLGDAQDVKGFSSNGVWGDAGCEDNGMLVLRNAKGNLASIHSSWTEWRGYGYRVEVYGTRGVVRFGYPPLWLALSQGEPGSRMRTRYQWFPGYQIRERWHGWRWALVRTLIDDTASWVGAAQRGEQASASGRSGLAAVQVAEQVERTERVESDSGAGQVGAQGRV